LRILFLSLSYPGPLEPTKGPFNRALVAALAERDPVEVVAPVPWPLRLRPRRPGGSARPCEDPPGVSVHRPTFFYPPRVLHHLSGVFLWASVRRTVCALLPRFGPEAVLGYWAHPDGEAALRAARLAGVPAGLIAGGSDVLVLTRARRRQEAVRRVLAEVDAVFAVGPHLQRRVLELGVPADRVHLFPHGVDSTRFHPGDTAVAIDRIGLGAGAPLVLWVGRMVPVKGLYVLLGACARLREQGCSFRLRLIGGGPLRKRLERRARRLGLGSVVGFEGEVDNQALPDWYRAAAVTVLPSFSEGLPNVLLESLACGTPFVATRVGSVPELADGAGQDLVEPGDVEGLARALAAVLACPRKRPAEVHYTWRDSADTVNAILERLRDASLRRRDDEARARTE
jgi:glycosyltransferase involved in cell wall biosynthesis